MAPDAFIQAPIETDPTALLEDSVTDFQTRQPGWVPRENDPLYITLAEGAAMGAECREVASDVPATIFMWYGAKLEGLPPITAAQAVMHATVIAIDEAGYTIPAGMVVGARGVGDDLIMFEVADDVTIAPGDLATADGEVFLQALDEGSAQNGLGGAGEELVAVTILTDSDGRGWVDGVEATDLSEGGADDEDVETYLNRLSSTLSLSSPRLILPADFATMAKTIPQVDRALVLDLYKPGPPYDPTPAATNVPRCVTVAVVDQAGQPVPNRADVAVLLESFREVNFLVFVVDPSYTDVDVTYVGQCYPGFDPDDVEARVDQALADYLSPQNWGLGPGGEVRSWVQQDHAEYLEVATVINNVDGFWRLTSLTLGKNGGTQTANTNVLLDGVAPLAANGAIVGTVTAP